MLKSSFLKQQEIVERVMGIEKTLGIMVPGGNKYVDTLRKLAVAILRQELKRPKKAQTEATN
jgi:phosphoribosylformylglycinamidine (FGAM) synthase-like amidotransferase family enzyme